MQDQPDPNRIKPMTSETAMARTTPPSRPRLSARTRVALAAASFVAAVSVGWFVARPAYRHYQELNSLEQAKVFFSLGDWSGASLCARRALALNPRSLEACRIMARLAEIAGAPQVLDWRRRIVELSPALEDRLALAANALRVERPSFPLAAQTLDALSPDAKALPGYHVLSAELALKLNQPSRAEAHFLEASRLEPANELHQLNLAVLRLRATNEVVAAAARATLGRLRADTNLGPTALRWLVSDRLEHDDLNTAQVLSGELIVRPAAVLDDRLTHLGILRKANSSEFGSYLTAVQRLTSTNAGATYTLCGWMAANSLADQALRWLANCPQSLQGQLPVRMAQAECHAALKDWSGLTRFLESERWGEVEFLRLAWLSRGAVEQKEEFAAEAQWRLAAREAGDGLGRMLTLLKLATNWGRLRERQELLWLIVQKYPDERWALKELDRLYVAEGNTRGLNKVHAALVAADSSDTAARNNLAATSLLLKVNLPRAHELSKEIYVEHPQEPVIASTYGYSLHLQGRTREGLAVMEKLPLESLKTPAVALYYGILLRADGRAAAAQRFLALARSAKLLPEEAALLEAAQQGM